MFKALKSFGGKISMKKGEIKDLNDKDIIKDLLHSGYIEEIKDETKNISTKVKNEVKKVEEEIKDDIKKIKNSKKK